MESVWHTISANDALRALSGTESGLTQAEAEQRLARHGRNMIALARNVSPLRRFLAQFHNVLIYILMSAAVITAFLQHWTDTGVIAAVILINAVIGFIQEAKAEQALAAIRNLLSPQANVLRDGQSRMMDAALLVPGDVVLLMAGDKVPADLRLLEAHSLRTQEAILTGESLDVEKSIVPVISEAALGDRKCVAYSGTLVTAGQGKGVVVATGTHTEIGRIGALLAQVETPQTPLTLKLARFSRWLAAFIVALAMTIFIFGVSVRGVSMNDMFMVMIGIAVSAIPEGLPAVISITLALGVRTMARRNAIVRHLPVIEALGNVTVICTDKTGTLTRNELSVSDLVTAEQQFSVTGVGYSPEGAVLFDCQEIELAQHPTLRDIGHAAMLNNDATLSLRKGVWELSGDPTEGALMAFALKAGHETETTQAAWPRTDVIPFSAEARYMATLHHGEEAAMIYVKGAPEKLLSMCDTQQHGRGDDRPLDKAYWEQQVETLARQGKRVLAIAHRHVPPGHRKLQASDVEKNLTLMGLFGIMDAPREEAQAAIADSYAAGIAVKMITGDHVMTASAIGKMLGIRNSERVMTGADMERLSEAALSEAVEEVNIYARMHPEHKLRLVEALQAKQEVVAMTGDGVNDAPALKKADIGISMGKQGTEVAKEASSLVLTDDNFASIMHAVEEGRNIYDRLRKTIVFMLVTDGAEGLCLVLAVLGGLLLPITPLQILWVNMVTAVTLSLAFAFAPNDARVMRRGPTRFDAPILSAERVVRMGVHIALIAGGTLGLFYYSYHHGQSLETARTMAVNALVFFQVYYLWAMFPKTATLSRWLLPLALPSLAVIALQGAFTHLSIMQRLFATQELGVQQWSIVVFSTALILVWLEMERLIRWAVAWR